MPRLNVERTHEVRAWNAHHEYLEQNFKGYSVNEGWCQDGYTLASKVYGRGVVITSFTPPYVTDFEEF